MKKAHGMDVVSKEAKRDLADDAQKGFWQNKTQKGSDTTSLKSELLKKTFHKQGSGKQAHKRNLAKHRKEGSEP